MAETVFNPDQKVRVDNPVVQHKDEEHSFYRILELEQRAKDMIVSCNKQQSLQVYNEFINTTKKKVELDNPHKSVPPILEAPEDLTAHETNKSHHDLDRLSKIMDIQLTPPQVEEE